MIEINKMLDTEFIYYSKHIALKCIIFFVLRFIIYLLIQFSDESRLLLLLRVLNTNLSKLKILKNYLRTVDIITQLNFQTFTMIEINKILDTEFIYI